MFDRRRFLRAVLGIAALGPLSSVPRVEEEEVVLVVQWSARWCDPGAKIEVGDWIEDRIYFADRGDDTDG